MSGSSRQVRQSACRSGGLNAFARSRNRCPIVVLSVRSDEPGKVAALDAGADDYMVKPFGAEELLARVRTALRHRLQQQRLSPVFHLHDLSLDFMAHRVMSKREFELLRLLAEHAGKVMTHHQILTAVWGEAHGEDVEYLRVYVRQLRSKLGDDPAAPRFIETEPGWGTGSGTSTPSEMTGFFRQGQGRRPPQPLIAEEIADR